MNSTEVIYLSAEKIIKDTIDQVGSKRMSVEKENSIKYWDDMHAKLDYERDKIAVDDWLEKFEDIIVAAKLPAIDPGKQ